MKERKLPAHLRRQGQLHRAQDHQPGGPVQAVPRQDRSQERALPVHLRRRTIRHDKYDQQQICPAYLKAFYQISN